MAFALKDWARLLLFPIKNGHINGAAGFASCCRPLGCSPLGAFDTGLRPDPFPDQAASLLPGLLVVTRTGLPPAGDDELMCWFQSLHSHLQHAGRTPYNAVKISGVRYPKGCSKPTP